MQPDQELLNSIKAAVLRAVASLARDRPGERLAGLALITDDGLETLSCLAVTRETLAASSDDDLIFSPTDWPYAPDEEAFDVADGLLRARASAAPEFSEHVDSAFSMLSRSLFETKAARLFADDVFLCALSSDPSEHLEALEAASVEQLNNAAVVADWRAFQEKWS